MNVKELVLQYYEGDTEIFPGIEVTIKSLREVYSGPVIVLHKNVSSKLLTFLHTYNIETFDCNALPVIYQTSAFNNKIIYSYLFLKNNKRNLKDKNILFCDIGDIYFQKNPFDLQTNNIYLSLESEQIKYCEVNSSWLKICYNEEIFNKIKERVVVNSGFILGTYEQILSLFNLITNEMSKIFSKINYPITDQAIVNKLVYYDNVDSYLGENDIINMSQYKGSFDFNDKIIHQYKVNSGLMHTIYSKYNVLNLS